MIWLFRGSYMMNKSNVKAAPFIHGSEVSINLHIDLDESGDKNEA